MLHISQLRMTAQQEAVIKQFADANGYVPERGDRQDSFAYNEQMAPEQWTDFTEAAWRAMSGQSPNQAGAASSSSAVQAPPRPAGGFWNQRVPELNAKQLRRIIRHGVAEGLILASVLIALFWVIMGIYCGSFFLVE